MKTIRLLTVAALGSTAVAVAQPHPRTLLEITGAPRVVPHLADSVVLIIDAQRDYTATGQLPLVGIDAALHETQRLLTRARSAGVPIVHI